MEKLFGISYPTVKNRLNSIAGKLEFIEIDPPALSNEILRELDNIVRQLDDLTVDVEGKEPVRIFCE